MSSASKRPYRDPTADAAIRNIMRGEKKSKPRPLVFVCSPLAGAMEENLRNARRYCRFAVKQGCVPYAPHLFFPQFLDEHDAGQRNLGILLGLAMMARCNEMWVFGRRLSEGMRKELSHAMKLEHIRIRYFDEQCNPLPNDVHYMKST